MALIGLTRKRRDVRAVFVARQRSFKRSVITTNRRFELAGLTRADLLRSSRDEVHKQRNDLVPRVEQSIAPDLGVVRNLSGMRFARE
jgi:hypothetical protein